MSPWYPPSQEAGKTGPDRMAICDGCHRFGSLLPKDRDTKRGVLWLCRDCREKERR